MMGDHNTDNNSKNIAINSDGSQNLTVLPIK